MNKKNINVQSIIIFSQRIFNRADRIEKELHLMMVPNSYAKTCIWVGKKKYGRLRIYEIISKKKVREIKIDQINDWRQFERP